MQLTLPAHLDEEVAHEEYERQREPPGRGGGHPGPNEQAKRTDRQPAKDQKLGQGLGTISERNAQPASPRTHFREHRGKELAHACADIARRVRDAKRGALDFAAHGH